jgi:hypothetical protein
MNSYKIQPGDSPALIARAFGVPFDKLIAANPHKPTTVVAGRRTWSGVIPGEKVRVPVGVGDAVADAINALVAAGGPCLQANVSLVCNAQRALGVTVDGKWGSGSSTAARARVSSAPAACSPRPAWWAPVGQSNCPTAAAAPAPAPSVSVATVPPAVQALVGIDLCNPANVAIVCAAQKALGVTVDGKYGSDTANAAYRRNPNVPKACSPRPLWWAPAGKSNCGGVTTATSTPAAPPPPPPSGPIPATTVAPSTSSAPAAVQALLTINPCAQSSAPAVAAAQRALGVMIDGKYGNDTATAARRVLPSAPAGCSPRPTWWAPAGQTNVVPTTKTQSANQAAAAAQTATQAAQEAQSKAAAAPGDTQAAAAAQAATQAAQTAQTAAQAAQTASSTDAAAAAAQTAAAAAQTAQNAAQGGLVAPEQKKLSTGAIVVGAVGAAALVGLVAFAVSGKKKGGTRSHGHSSRRPTHHPKKRKPAHKKKRK